MKKILAFMLLVALCIPVLFACSPSPLEEVALKYNVSAPTKVAATTKQVVGSLELDCSYELITGTVDGKAASVFTVVTEEIRSVEEGGNTEEIKEIIKTTTKKTEAIEGQGARVNGGEWNPEGTPWAIGRGRMALNLDEDSLENVVYENNTLTFTIPVANVATVLGEEYSQNIGSDVEVVIVDDGAVVTSIDLHYFLKADESINLPASEMTVKVVYTYDIERINIEK